MTQDGYEEIDLSALSDDELVEQMQNDLYDGMKDEIVEGTNLLLGRGWAATRVLDDALVAGMKIVGIDFRDGILFVPEVLLAANAMKAGMAILRPLLAETGAEPIGKVVIGTVKGDIHDIGKNLVGMMLEGAGFEVVDLGINTDADKFIAALEQHKPDILGMTRAADDDDALHEGRHRRAQEPWHPRRLHRPGWGRAAERGVRRGGRGGRVLPGCRRRGRDGPPADRCATCRRVARSRSLPRPASLIVGCGALGASSSTLTRDLPGVDVTCLPAELHNRPERIPAAVADRVRSRGARLRPSLRGLCGLRDGRPARCRRSPSSTASSGSPGAHCYEFYAGAAAFAALQDEEPGTFYLTDFLARQLRDRLVIRGLGLDRHPELLSLYFGNYRRLVYLAQTDDAELDARGRARPRVGSAWRSSVARPGSASSSRRSSPRCRDAVAPDGGDATVIWWRDIPAQVVAKDGRRASKIVLHPRFQVAIDRAAMKADRREMNAYIAEWRREARRCGDDLETEAARRGRSPGGALHQGGSRTPSSRRAARTSRSKAAQAPA